MENGSNFVVDNDLLTDSTVERFARSDLCSHSRDTVIITTAGLPRMTGTAVNPFLRTLYSKKEDHSMPLFVLSFESCADHRFIPERHSVLVSGDQARVILQFTSDQILDIKQETKGEVFVVYSFVSQVPCSQMVK